MENFVCSGCGNCCKKFGPKGLPLFDFEVEKIKNIVTGLDIRPTEVFLDKKSGIKFSVLYGLFDEPCPFLEKNICKIYNNRFLICRQFPIFSTANFKFSSNTGLPSFMKCTKFDCKGKFEEFAKAKCVSEIENYLKETYGDCFEFAKKSNEETERIMNKLIELEKSGKVELEGVDYKTLKKDNVVNLREFLEKIN
jgi:Fe-S-cluster containining protein